jgi:hypothetical protein
MQGIMSTVQSQLTPYQGCDSELLQHVLDPLFTGIQTRDTEYTQGA